jgi:hypothetical protein
VICADLWQVVDMQVNSYVICADLWQVVDMQVNNYVICAEMNSYVVFADP